jgi:hypothetical protein
MNLRNLFARTPPMIELVEVTRPTTQEIVMSSKSVEFYRIDTGHFALADKADDMVPLIRDFLGRKVARQ